MLTTHEITAELEVTRAEAVAEKQAAPRWYVLPEGWTWERVAAHRMIWGQPLEHYPLAVEFGVALWGVPQKPRRDPITLPFDPRREYCSQMATASHARRLPGGRLTARLALERCRFIRLQTPFPPGL